MSIKIEKIPQKNQKYTVEIVDYGANGEGIAKIDGFAVFVPFALLHEIVEIQIIVAKKNFALGKVINILQKSDKRVDASCKYFSKCGGCQLQHACYDEQLEIKTNIVKNTIEKYTKTNVQVEKCVASPKQYGYRNKFAFPLFEQNDKICAGMYRPSSHNIVQIDDCLIQEDCKFVIDNFLQFANEQQYPVYSDVSKKGVRHIVGRTNNDGVLLCVVSTEKLQNLQKFAPILQQKYKNVHIVNNINKMDNNVILGDKDYVVFGSGELEYDEFGIVYQVNTHSFLQVNTEIKKLLYSAVLENIKKSDVVIDAYSGAGVLSATIAKKCKEVYAVEIVPEAIKNAEQLKAKNKVNNLKNICGDCALVVPKIAADKKANVVVLDPPRKGCDQKVIDALIEGKPNKIIYISCNPATLARDLQLMLSNYKIIKIQPYDMFPQTANVETLVVLEKQ